MFQEQPPTQPHNNKRSTPVVQVLTSPAKKYMIVGDFNSYLTQSIFSSSTSPWMYCLPDERNSHCNMLRDATEADMFDFRRTVSLDDLSDFEGGVPLSSINKPYQVEWNDDLFPTKSIISQCILTSNEMCVQAFNQTNPNNYSPPQWISSL